jgi:hypothetical protein
LAIGEILKSGILKEIPLDLFCTGKWFDWYYCKCSCKSQCVLSLLRLHNIIIWQESFFWRVYQEAHTNYFEDLEQKSYSFPIVSC